MYVSDMEKTIENHPLFQIHLKELNMEASRLKKGEWFFCNVKKLFRLNRITLHRLSTADTLANLKAVSLFPLHLSKPKNSIVSFLATMVTFVDSKLSLFTAHYRAHGGN